MHTRWIHSVPALTLAACLATTTLAQEGQPAAPATETPDKPAAAAPQPAATCELLTPGSEPRRQLRYQLSKDTRQTTTLTMDMSSVLVIGADEAPPSEMPTMQLRLDVSVSEGEEGRFKVIGELKEAKTRAEDSDNSILAIMLDQALGQMVGVRTINHLDVRGFSHQSRVETPDGMDEQAAQMARNMEPSMTQLGIHLPEQPVGKGATWKVTVPIVTQGIKMKQTIEYQLAAIEGDTIDLILTMQQSAGTQPMPQDNLPPGMRLELISLTGEGTGTAKVNLRRPAATINTSDMRTEALFRTLDGDEGQNMKQVIQMKLNLKSEDSR